MGPILIRATSGLHELNDLRDLNLCTFPAVMSWDASSGTSRQQAKKNVDFSFRRGVVAAPMVDILSGTDVEARLKRLIYSSDKEHGI